MTSYSMRGKGQDHEKPDKKPDKIKKELGMIFNDTTIILSNGDEYLCEDLSRLTSIGATVKVDQAYASIASLCRYLPRYYPGFRPCSNEQPEEWTKYLFEENEKVRRDIAAGKPAPTRAEWEARVKPTRDALLGRHRREMPDILFRVSKEGVHQGTLCISEIQIMSRTPEDVRLLAAQVTLALDIGENNNDAAQAISTQMVIFMLKNRFFRATNSEVFQLKHSRLPNLYERLIDPTINAEVVSGLTNANVFFNVYPNTPAQDTLGIVKVRDVSLTPLP